jgi:chemotaxis response regulator CheB
VQLTPDAPAVRCVEVVKRARALIVDEEPAFRARLRNALGAHVEVVGEAPDAAEGAAFVAEEVVDLVVMSLPRAEELETARELLEHDPGLVLVLLNRCGADAHGPTELHGLAKLLVGLGSLPRRHVRQCLGIARAGV